MTLDFHTIEVGEDKRTKFVQLFDEFARTYPGTPEGQRHIEMYERGREQGRRNFEEIVAAADRGEVITEQVLLKMLPYTNSANNRKAGAWIPIAPVFTTHVRKKFEPAGWTNPEDWPHVARAILHFVRRCVENPLELQAACEEFDSLPYSTGFQTGTLTPILNALRPDDFLLINNKSRRVINYFANTSHGQKLREYPATNTTGRELVRELAEVMHQFDMPALPDQDLLDMFSHWLVAVKKFDFRTIHTVRYWKIAPGENAWNWDACHEGGLIAIGWDKLGDVSGLSQREFDMRRDELVAKYDGWTKSGVNQVWKFYHIEKGDRIVANRGTTEVLGIGTVAGSYYFVEGQRHGHRLPVEWDDLTPRQVDEYGWRRTLVELDREKFEAICNATPLGRMRIAEPKIFKDRQEGNGYFTRGTFKLLAQLHQEPTYEFYTAHKDALWEHVVEPFKQLMMAVRENLTAVIREKMETEKRVFASILKQFVKQGCWDFYWGAFYPKGGKRTEDAQLFMWINRDRLEYGFYIGEYGSDQRNRFLQNCQKNRDVLARVLQDSLAGSPILFGEREDFVGEPEDFDLSKTWPSFEDWLKDPAEAGIHAAVFLPKEKVLQQSATQLVEEIADVYQRLFPLVLLATLDNPMPAIGDYLERGEPPLINPEYPLAQCAKDTGFDETLLARWARGIERKGQAIVYGPPGTGKTYLAEHLARHLIGGGDGFYEVVQFHPAYAYEDFVQGIRPKAKGDGQLDYPTVPGRFLEFCEKAEGCHGCCVLIIDEINRANLARVLGELMYLLEYRDREVPLAGGGFLHIPTNVRIVGTMNTADRSIALVDHALRRRFAFLALYPNYDILRRYHQGTDFDVEPLISVLRKLNRQIGDPHYEVGITFFLRQDLTEQIEDIWRMEIEPYLEEYFFDQRDKVDAFRWKEIGKEILP